MTVSLQKCALSLIGLITQKSCAEVWVSTETGERVSFVHKDEATQTAIQSAWRV